jgi:SAM-dependent methyltransferase
MIRRIFVSVIRISPALRKVLWRQLYQLIAGLYRIPEWTFMNFGYASVAVGEAVPDLLARDEPERTFIQLYHHVIAGENLQGKDVAEIGCGRGGGCSYIGRYLGARSVCGVDLSDNAVRFCRERHQIPVVRFEVGDSENLPFPNDSFDAAVNVESSHYYPSMGRFLAEVLRVLRPGGTFHFADLRDIDQIGELQDAIDAAGMRVERQREITGNVIEAIRRDGERRVALFSRSLPRLVARYFAEFAGVEGTTIHEKLMQGKVLYYSYLLRKT